MRTTKKTLLFLILFIGLSYAQYHGVYAPIRLYPITAANLAAKGFDFYDRLVAMRDSFMIYSFERNAGYPFGNEEIIIDSVLSHRLAREKYRDTTFKKDTLFSLAGSGHKTLDTATYLSGVWSYKFHRLKAWTNITISDTAGDLYFSSTGGVYDTATIVRTFGNQTIGGSKQFTGSVGVDNIWFTQSPNQQSQASLQMDSTYNIYWQGTKISLVGHLHTGADITSGIVASARLGSGTASSTTYLKGDSTWGTISAGANTSLSNLTTTAINTALLPGVSGLMLGNIDYRWDNVNLDDCAWITWYNNATNLISIRPTGGVSTGFNLINIPNASGTITVSASSPLALSALGNLTIPAATASVAGHATAAQITKLDGIAAGAQPGTVTAVSGTAPVASSGGITPAISMAAATTLVSGHLTSTDWNTFNNKAPAAGSTSITTLGTIGTGTWNATAIPDSEIVSAANWNTAYTHTGNTSNPHSVTKAQVGLPNYDGALITTTSVTGFAVAGGTSIRTLTVDADILTSAIQAHVNSTANPHSVTKAQVGLANVENTALSTWAGSTNITTLGTIGTGIWNASTITIAKGGTNNNTYTAGQLLSYGFGQISSSGYLVSDFAPAAGSTSITTLGTIGTGIWNATAIPDSEIVSATNWNIAYADRMKWDGGAIGLVAATGRASLGLGGGISGTYYFYHGNVSGKVDYITTVNGIITAVGIVPPP